ncbi:hypothetical protein ACQKP0_03795 [Heyndrickxia sp. NPDC080065]|uniref:hypothetical protein n=1 Tax=Heyndrickxia sp. NPDC080065 TaxID=3390568 RepID=UPI003CFFCE24
MKLFRSAAIFGLFLMLFCILGQNSAFAASKTDTLVNNAIKAGKTLTNVTTVEKKANGKSIPTKEYNAAVKAYKSAKSAVNKQSAKQKKTNLSKLKTVNTQITRGKKYIDAVTYGKKIAQKKATLDKYVKTGSTKEMLNTYSSLLSDIKKYSPKFDAVYGKKTRDTIKKLYKTPADKIIKDLNYPVTVKKSINETTKLIKESASSSKLAAQ